MSMNTLLETEIEEKFNKFADMDPGSKEYASAVDSVTKLMDRVIELEKLDTSETQTENQMNEERKARLTKNCIDIGSIVLPLIVTIWGTKASFKFEETGSITTAVGRKFIDKLFTKR